jgi:hypothetical protein
MNAMNNVSFGRIIRRIPMWDKVFDVLFRMGADEGRGDTRVDFWGDGIRTGLDMGTREEGGGRLRLIALSII